MHCRPRNLLHSWSLRRCLVRKTQLTLGDKQVFGPCQKTTFTQAESFVTSKWLTESVSAGLSVAFSDWVISVCFQPIMAVFRPHPGDANRIFFNWAHWGVGTLAHTAASEYSTHRNELSVTEKAFRPSRARCTRRVSAVRLFGHLNLKTQIQLPRFVLPSFRERKFEEGWTGCSNFGPHDPSAKPENPCFLFRRSFRHVPGRESPVGGRHRAWLAHLGVGGVRRRARPHRHRARDTPLHAQEEPRCACVGPCDARCWHGPTTAANGLHSFFSEQSQHVPIGMLPEFRTQNHGSCQDLTLAEL